jgi:hypothetical protein
VDAPGELHRLVVDRVLPIAFVCTLAIWPWAGIVVLALWQLSRLNE